MKTAELVQRHRHQNGFSYLGLLFAIAVAGLTLALAGEVWNTNRQREKELELLFIGHQFRAAIRSYYEFSPSAGSEFPHALEDLLLDPRSPGVRRHLRRIYADPMTGSSQWGLVLNESGTIQGVYSLSGQAPVKTANFNADDREFQGKATYRDWKFEYTPQGASNLLKSGGEEGNGFTAPEEITIVPGAE